MKNLKDQIVINHKSILLKKKLLIKINNFGNIHNKTTLASMRTVWKNMDGFIKRGL